MRRLRVYIDTSVLGAAFDEEFKEATTAFFDQARDGRFAIVLSTLVEDEIADAPKDVRDLYAARSHCHRHGMRYDRELELQAYCPL